MKFSSGRHLRTYVGQMKSHYETLGITPSASQAEVKAAYYKKSMELHPDRVQGNRENFEEVASAYKTLSDPSIRKLYDRRERVNTENSSSRAKSSSGVGPHLGKTPVYDFDQWTRRHYGGFVKRSGTRREGAQVRNFFVDEREKENVTLALLSLIMCAVVITLVSADQRMSPKTNSKPERRRSPGPESPEKNLRGDP